MIYDVSGNGLTSVYSVNSSPLSAAYDVNGVKIWSANPVLKVMTYNCGQWLSGSGTGTSTEDQNAVNHRALLQDIMTAQDPDLLCVQEYWDVIGNTDVKDLLAQYMPYYQEVNGETAYYGHAVFSKYPITNFVTSALTSPLDFETVAESSNTGRYLDKCTITVDSIAITVFNTHLATSSQESLKVAQAELICDYLSNYNRFILCGDFNTVCKSTNDEEYTTIMKQFIDDGYHSANCSEQHGFIDTWTDSTDGTGTWYPCDQIITSGNITITDVTIDLTKLDYLDGVNTIDHVPLVATLVIQ